MTELPDSARRILLALDCAGDAAALEAAATLAEAMQAHLDTLFVEDPDLLQLARLPFTREIALASAEVRPLQTTDVERQLRLRAAAVRERLASGAERRRLEWSFSITRGRPAQAVLEAGARADLWVFGRAPTAIEAVRGGANVLTVLGHEPDGTRAVDVALRLATLTGGNFVVMAPSDTERAAGAVDAAMAEAQRRGVAGERLNLPEDREELARAAKARGAGVAVVQDAPEFRDPATLHALLRAIPCPVVLVR